MAAKWKIWKIECSDVLRCRFVVRHCTEFLKAYSESLLQDGSGHFLNFFLRLSWAEKTHLESCRTNPRGFEAVETVSTTAKPLRSILRLSRWVFLAQDGRRKKFKICPEPSWSFLNILSKILYDVWQRNSNVKRQETHYFVEPGGRGGAEGHIWVS